MKDREWAEKLLDEYETVAVNVLLANASKDDEEDYKAYREQIILHLTNVPEDEKNLGDKDV